MSFALSPSSLIIAAYVLYGIAMGVLMFTKPLLYVRYSQWFGRDIALRYKDEPRKIVTTYFLRATPSLLAFTASVIVDWQAAFIAMFAAMAIIMGCNAIKFGKHFYTRLTFDAPENVVAHARF